MQTSPPKHTNQLTNELSPYLLQHAHNPVNWYPYGQAALAKAKQENKPILISIGYAACHWCHVMERESFENETVAAFMNQHFVNIKVDREERPDLDSIYMEAVQVLTGAGGWPLNCFLTPNAKPFFGGTYYPPQPMHNRPSWMQVLQGIHNAFTTKRTEVDQQANQLTYHISTQDSLFFKSAVLDVNYQQPLGKELPDAIYQTLLKNADTDDGGFGGAPKFPSTMSLHYLLNYYQASNKQAKDALKHALFSIDKMIYGGIYDQLGGGFARYTVDKQWLVPHFEKMLYDNALLVGLIAKAYKITQNPLYQETIEQTLNFIKREMTSEEGGFYSSYDADSEGEEGKFYVWDKAEIDRILQDDAIIFNRFYEVSETGNWEGKNILNRHFTYQAFADKIGYEEEPLKRVLKNNRQDLLAERDKRIKPGLDDKIILGWNAMMCTAFAQAYEALGQEDYKDTALKNMHFLLEKYQVKEGDLALYHTYKNGKRLYPAFLDDYALLIEALLSIYQISLDDKWMQLADQYTQYVLDHFSEAGNPIFYYTTQSQTDVIVRKKEFYDNATPSGNSTMANNLYRLGILLDKTAYKERSINMLKAIEDTLARYAQSFARWANLALQLVYPPAEIAIVGEEAEVLTKKVNALFIANKLLMASKTDNKTYELLQNRYQENETLIYFCKNYTCQAPVQTVSELKKVMAAVS